MPPALFDPPVRPRVAVHTLLRGIRCFAKLSPEAIDALAAVATELPYTAGETIFLEGDPATGLFVLENGVVKISRVSLEGRGVHHAPGRAGRELQRRGRHGWRQ